MTLSDLLQRFAPWQDLIDEREIFLLYIDYGSDFCATPDDLALAKKNMGFICKKPEWSKLLPQRQCQ